MFRGPQAHLQESSYSYSHNHWFSICAALFACSVCCVIQSTRTEWNRNWTNGCVNSCTNSPEDGPVGPKHVEIQQYTNKIETSVGFHSMFVCLFVCLLLARQPPVGQGFLIHEVFRSHTTTHHSRLASSGRVISSSQRPLPDNTQHSQQTNIHAPSGIRTYNPSRRAAADLHLRPRGHRDRQMQWNIALKYYFWSALYIM